MTYLLIGIDCTLSDEHCDTVRLCNSSDGAVVVYLRQGEDAWGREDRESDPVHTQELLETIKNGFGGGFDRAECLLPDEKITYALVRGSVKVSRGPREEATAAPAVEEGMEVLTDALGIPRSRRKAKLKQACRFAGIVEQALSGAKKESLRILDLACGRSYLGFVLVHQLSVLGHEVQLHGVDSNEALVGKCRDILKTLRWTNCTFEVQDLASYAVAAGEYDIVVSLHGCDTLSDEAIRIACGGRVPLLFVAPCCQHELRHQWKAHPLQWISRYGLLEQRLADVLTDAFRCTVLEALGYRVKVLRFAAPDITPKNLLIQAELASGPDPRRAADARTFLRQFGVRPRLAALLEDDPADAPRLHPGS